MTDFKIDKEEYPQEIIYVPSKDGGYLTEVGNETVEYRPASILRALFHAPLSLKIIPPLTHTAYVGHFSGSEFNTTARLVNPENSLSFFGTDREIENIYIDIFSIRKGMQLQFRGDLSQKYDDYFISDSQEHLSITMAIEHTQFERILRLWELDNIENMRCELKAEIINGLYEQDSYAPYIEYKVLPDKRIVKNYQEMPENFTDFNNSKTYYISNDCFDLTIKKQKSFQTKNENDFIEETNGNQDKDKYLNVAINNIGEIRIYARYLAFIMTVILLITLLK